MQCRTDQPQATQRRLRSLRLRLSPGRLGDSHPAFQASKLPRLSRRSGTLRTGKNARHTTPTHPPLGIAALRSASSPQPRRGWVRKNAGQERGRGKERPYHCPAAWRRVSRCQSSACRPLPFACSPPPFAPKRRRAPPGLAENHRQR